ncbi:MAG: hypothetical protein HY735_25205 [Verrucomicrobia bacterium]|nr:hypothetical protein [Verrucomicrobiota bacterium]
MIPPTTIDAINLGYAAITKVFNPTLGYIPRRDVFGPSLFGQYGRDSDKDWYKRLRLHYYGRYSENEQRQTILRDHSLGATVVFPNDLGLQVGQDLDFHAPFDNRRSRAELELFSSDYWKSVELGWAGGVFEETDLVSGVQQCR